MDPYTDWESTGSLDEELDAFQIPKVYEIHGMVLYDMVYCKMVLKKKTGISVWTCLSLYLSHYKFLQLCNEMIVVQ